MEQGEASGSTTIRVLDDATFSCFEENVAR
jgi:hypothetical protein